MRLALSLAVALLAASCASTGDVAGAPAEVRSDAPSDWATIRYPDLACRWGPGRASALVGYRYKADLRFDLLFSGSFAQLANLPREGEVAVRVHLRDGGILEPERATGWRGIASTNGYGGTSDNAMFFPWPANDLSEAWIEVRFPERTFWLEVPYGLARDPAAPPPSPEPDQEAPRPAPAMRALTSTADVVSWSEVRYELRTEEAAVELTVVASPGVWATYRLHGRFGGENRPPEVTAAITGPGIALRSAPGPEVRMFQGDLRLEPGESPPGRSWGTLTLRAGDLALLTALPSSLWRAGHARAVVPSR